MAGSPGLVRLTLPKDEAHAEVICSLLRAFSIECTYVPVGETTSCEVLVFPRDLAVARELLESEPLEEPG
jgi:hypothetical protein